MNWSVYFTCNPSTGVLTWKTRPISHFKSQVAFKVWNARFANKPAGSKVRGRYYSTVQVGQKLFPVHRVIWEMVHESIPDGVLIDHKDRNISHNWISNLRVASKSQNARNCGMMPNNTSGHKGVHWCRRAKKWIAKFRVSGRQVYVGSYLTPSEAHEAYECATLRECGEFAYPTG